MPDTPALPDFTRWPSFPFEGNIRVKALDPPVDVEPPRKGEDPADCTACAATDDAYIWVSDRWRVRAMDRPTGLPMVLILESRSHLDLGDLPNMLAAELGVMTVRLERAIRSLDDVARVHVNRWGDGEAHLHLWFMGRPQGRLQLRGTFLSLWDEILPPVPEAKWRENLALVAAWLAEFGGTPLAAPPRIDWKSPATLESAVALDSPGEDDDRADARAIEHAGGSDGADDADAATTHSAEDPRGADDPHSADDPRGADDADTAGGQALITPRAAVPKETTAVAAESTAAAEPTEPAVDEATEAPDPDEERIRRPVPGGASRS